MVKRLTTEEFIKYSKDKFGDKFKYECTEYKTQKDAVDIECLQHGVITLLPWSHLKSPTGCPKCSRDNTYTTTEEFIKKAVELRGGYFDYSETQFIDWNTNIKVGCRKHGQVEILPKNHLYGSKNSNGCPKCGIEVAVAKRSVDYDAFIERCIQKYGKKFKYIKQSWNGLDADIEFICPRHGQTSMKAKTHIRNSKNNTGCKHCGQELIGKTRKMSSSEFFARCKVVHEDKYDYSNSSYTSTKKNITILCKSEGHGEFTQIAGAHIRGSSCPRCSSTRLRTNIDFIKSCKKIHGDMYDYSKTEYIGSNKKVIITCRLHGDFPQNATSHLNGSGCPECSKTMKIGWDNLEELLEEKDRHNQECDFYLYSLTGYPGLVKIGIASNHSKRAESYGKERNLPYGELICVWRCSTRIAARFVEMSVLQDTISKKDIPEELIDKIGFTEIRRCSEEEIMELSQHTFDSLYDWIENDGTIWQWALDNIKLPQDIRMRYQEKVNSSSVKGVFDSQIQCKEEPSFVD